MAQVKFNRGNYGANLSAEGNSISFLHATANNPFTEAAPQNDYGFIYLGSILSATKYLRALDLTGISGLPTTSDVHDVIPVVSANATTSGSTVTAVSPDIRSAKRFLLAADLDGYDNPLDTDILSAAAVSSLIGTVSDNWYHTGKGWNQAWTAGGTEQTASWKTYVLEGHGTPDIAITLPIDSAASGITIGGSTVIPTSQQVAQYISGLAGGMRYCGSVSSTTLPTTSFQPYKPGDVFIASASFTIGTGSSAKIVSEGDMVILNSSATSGTTTLTATNCDVYEKNLKYEVEKSSSAALGTNLSYNVVVGDGTSTVQSIATGTTAGKTLRIKSEKVDTSDRFFPSWEDTEGFKFATGVSGHIGQIEITRWINGAISSATATSWENGMTFTSGKLYLDVDAKKVVQTANTTGASGLPILFSHSASPTSGNPDSVEYNTSVTIKPSTGDIQAHDISLTQTVNSVSTTVTVFDAILWHEL